MHAFQTTHYLNNTTSIGIANLHVHLISLTLYLILRHVLQNKNSKTTTKHSLSPKSWENSRIHSFQSFLKTFFYYKPSCTDRIHKFSQENEAGKGGSRDNCVWHGGEGSFKAYLWEIYFVKLLYLNIVV